MSEISQKQLEANRENAKLGGVKTEEGKAVSKYNALKHGLLSQEVLLYGEDEEALIEMGKRLRVEMKPQTEFEFILIDRITANVWRLKRVMQMEREMMEKSREGTFNKENLSKLGATLTHYDIKKIETSFLRKHKYFTSDSWKSGTITWTSGWSENKSSVGIEVSTSENYLRIHYTQTDNYSGEKKDFDYKIPLTTTPCNLGGNRYWFICPWYKNGVYCSRRVGVLYKDGDYFACRHCYNLTYSSRKLSGRYKRFGRIISLPEIEKLRAEAKRTHYKGKYTRKYLRYLRTEEKSENAFAGMIYLLSNKFKI